MIISHEDSQMTTTFFRKKKRFSQTTKNRARGHVEYFKKQKKILSSF